MKAILRADNFKELLIKREDQRTFASGKDFIQNFYRLEYHKINGTMRERVFNGFKIEQRSVDLGSDLEVEVEHDVPLLKMHFEIEGSSNFHSLSKGSHSTYIEGGRHQLFFFPNARGKLNYLRGRNRKTVEIYLSKEFFFNALSGCEDKVYLNLLKSVQEEKVFRLHENDLPISPKIRLCLYDIINSESDTQLARSYIKNKVVELLILQLNQIKNLEDVRELRIDTKDIERLYYIREYIDNNLYDDFSIERLGKLAGINIQKLKNGFNSLFKMTVFRYIRLKRLEEAKFMILNSSNSLAEISYLVGYKNPQHFTTAFKKEFGYLPSELRKN